LSGLINFIGEKNKMNNKKEEKTHLSRREALKLLAATSGAVTVLSLPVTWKKPIVEVGTLPTHAQSSPVNSVVTISNLAHSTSQGGCDAGGGQTGKLTLLTFNYNDTGSYVLPNQTRLRADFLFASGSTDADERTLTSINITGDGDNGIISVPVCIDFGTDTSVDLTMSITNSVGVKSNSEAITITTSALSVSEQQTGQSRGKIVEQ
jgi:hypothetical protein